MMAGDVVRKPGGKKAIIKFMAADSLGFRSVRLIQDGKVVREIPGAYLPKIEENYAYTFDSKESYFRLEAVAADRRRAFSSPLYFRSP